MSFQLFAWQEYKQKEKDKHKHIAVFPCKLRVLPEHIFNSRDPIVIGFHIEAGIIRLGTPLTVPTKEVGIFRYYPQITVANVFLTIVEINEFKTMSWMA